MRVYISGKITGTDDFMQRFASAEKMLRNRGYAVTNPAVCNAWMPEGTAWEKYMGESLRMLCECDAIFMLPGWKDSRGAKIEHSVALQMGLCIIEEDL